MTLPPDIRKKVALLVPRLASDFEGEVFATVRAISRTLAGGGGDLHDLAEVIRTERQPVRVPPPNSTYRPRPPGPPSTPTSDWRTIRSHCEFRGYGPLSERDIEFLDGLAAANRQHLSPRQQAWLGDIKAKLGMGRRTA